MGSSLSLPVIPNQRPRVRHECLVEQGGVRPCPWLSCRHHLLSDLAVSEMENALEILFDSNGPSCVLDVVDEAEDGLGIDRVAELLNISTEQAEELEESALTNQRLRGEMAEIDDYRKRSDELDSREIDTLLRLVHTFGVEATAELTDLPTKTVQRYAEREQFNEQIVDDIEPDDGIPSLEEADLISILFTDDEDPQIAIVNEEMREIQRKDRERAKEQRAQSKGKP